MWLEADEYKSLLGQIKSSQVFVVNLLRLAEKHPSEHVAAEVLKWSKGEFCALTGVGDNDKTH